MRLFNFRYSLIIALLVITLMSCQKAPMNNQFEYDLSTDWELFSSSGLNQTGNEISSPGYENENAYSTKVPSTVMGALVRNDVYENIFYSENLKHVSKEKFQVPWWYRKTFTIDRKTDSDFYVLTLEGLNYKADVWLNGEKIGSSDTLEGCFRMFDFDISNQISNGTNVLAIEIIPPEWGDLTIGFVDWNPWPPDNNMGLWRPVRLTRTGPISMDHIFVKPSLNLADEQTAEITVYADLSNHSGKQQSANVSITIEGTEIKQKVDLKPGEEKQIIFNPSEYSSLMISEPRLWWPNSLGEPNLYTINIKAEAGNLISDEQSHRFGIRKIEEYVNDNGHKGYKINGKKILIKGGGWVDDIFLDDTNEKVEDQIRYVKHMNLNTIRLEGFWGNNQKLFDYADEYGIMVMIGWSCQWEWEGYCGRPEDEFLAIRTEAEIQQHTRAYQDQVEWLRNHPSIFLWVYGSDKLLVPELEKKMNTMLAVEDPTRPILNSCGSAVSEITGESGVKMNGPYSYVTPNYWYIDEERGGAFGFNTETGPGVQPSPIESVKKMIPPEHLWPVDSIWEYHLGRNEFRTFRHWMNPFNQRYGQAGGVEEFTFKAQMANYEAMRAMFEAFAVNKPNTTGLIQWMLNSAWPGMLWQLYDWYLMPNGAFYGAKNASRPLNVIYNYKDKNIYLSNEYYRPFNNLMAEVRLFDNKSRELYSHRLEVSIGENESIKIHDMPELDNLSTTYFLDLSLEDPENATKIHNFYWLSNQEDVLDLENSEWFVTHNKSYADLTGINRLDKAEVVERHQFTDQGDRIGIEIDLENITDQLAFFIELKLVDPESKESILPVFWDDNYVTLLPGEERHLSGFIYKKDLDADSPVFELRGWNLKRSAF